MIQREEIVLIPEDERFPSDLFDFEQLKEIGLEHIGNLSGKIWTDHNVHDPGITILEMLCYALMDLGYRTKLPFIDLIAKPPTSKDYEDNFYSPAELLTQNPTTLLDFRRLLLELPGINNAWIRPVDEIGKVRGIYKIILDIKAPENSQLVIRDVWELLHRYRNVCEDFSYDITILKKEYFAVTAEIEVETPAELTGLYAEVLRQLYNYLSPSISHYTLQELLEKGKAIEDIYLGRPYVPQSLGFIDPEELVSIQPLKKIRISDLIRLILDIPGIKEVSEIQVSKMQEGSSSFQEKWVIELEEDCTPILDLENSKLTFVQRDHAFDIDHEKILSMLNRQGIRPPARVLSNVDLDLPIPNGRYREDLGTYYSIQNEFPLVYGIGPEGIGKQASLERKAQALQLKGYLLFYDRLLADYVAQISQLRSLFHIKTDPVNDQDSSPHGLTTYFLGNLDSVPNAEVLDMFQLNEDLFTQNEGRRAAFPMVLEEYRKQLSKQIEEPEEEIDLSPVQFNMVQARRSALESIRREFEQKNFNLNTFQIIRGEELYFRFIITFPESTYALIGQDEYCEVEEALQIAHAISFLGSFNACYRTTTQGKIYPSFSEVESDSPPPRDEFSYSFDLIWHLPDYQKVISNLLEKPETYRDRRSQILDHLLARFSESFTEYATVMFHLNGETAEVESQLISHKFQLLGKYDEIGRNRGKAWNYQLAEGLSATNRSGLLEKVEASLGIPAPTDKTICPFRLSSLDSGLLKYLIVFKENDASDTDTSPTVTFESLRTFGSENEAWDDKLFGIDKLTTEARNFSNFYVWEWKSKYVISVVSSEFRQAYHPSHYGTPGERDLMMEWVLEQGVPDSPDSPLIEYCKDSSGEWHYFVFAPQDKIKATFPVLMWRSVGGADSETEAKENFKDFSNSFPDSSPDDPTVLDQLRRLQVDNCGPFTFEWVDPDKELVRSSEINRYVDAIHFKQVLFNTINRENGYLIEHILLRPKNGELFGTKLDLFENTSDEVIFQLDWIESLPEEDMVKQYEPFKDSYSFWITAILPGWTHRTSNKNFRKLMERKLNAEAPAHCAFRFLWLGPKPYCYLEKLIHQWSKLINNQRTDSPLPTDYFRWIEEIEKVISQDQISSDFPSINSEKPLSREGDSAPEEILHEVPSTPESIVSESQQIPLEEGVSKPVVEIELKSLLENRKSAYLEALEKVGTDEFRQSIAFQGAMDLMERKGSIREFLGVGRNLLSQLKVDDSEIDQQENDFLHQTLNLAILHSLDELLDIQDPEKFETGLDLIHDFIQFNNVLAGHIFEKWHDEDLSQLVEKERIQRIKTVLTT